MKTSDTSTQPEAPPVHRDIWGDPWEDPWKGPRPTMVYPFPKA